MNPAPAMTIFSNDCELSKILTISFANSRGFFFISFAIIKAKFEVQSPCKEPCGLET